MSVQSGTIPLYIAEQPPQPALGRWVEVAACPCCGSAASESRAALPDQNYVFGAERIAYPDQGVAIVKCGACGLHYKSMVPAPALLEEIFARQAESKWAARHDFADEALLLRRLRGGAPFDLLDVGAAGGGLLEACSANGATSRRSALDVMRYTGIERHLAGEFIKGFLDDPQLAWSREPYDVVTLFDVLEHLYQPQIAFENLRDLVKIDGLIFLETGNSSSFWPRRLGVQEWWYVRLLEHHIFWSRPSLERMATAHGFRIVYWKEGRHKSRRRLSLPEMASDLLKTGLYCLAAHHYSVFAQMMGRQGNQPWYPFALDHFQACLARA